MNVVYKPPRRCILLCYSPQRRMTECEERIQRKKEILLSNYSSISVSLSHVLFSLDLFLAGVENKKKQKSTTEVEKTQKARDEDEK